MAETTSEYIDRISKEYSLYVLYNRAIPLITDGLKMSQRIGLWLLYNEPNKEIKALSLGGLYLSSNLYQHGDQSATDTIGRMAAPFLNNIPLIEGIGQFGSKTNPTAIGAPRYTYVKRTKFAEDVVWQDMDILPQMDNYDGSVQMPSTFLPLLPLVLLNGVKGIAIGYATNILPRSFKSLTEATIEAIETGAVTNPMIPYFHGYDVKVEDIGDGKFLVSGKLEKVNTSTVKVTELPPDVSIEQFKASLIKLEEEGKITDFIDNSSDVIDIDIKMRRSILMDLNEADLMEMFKLYSVMTENIVVLDWEGNKVLKYDNPQQLVLDFVNWRFGWYQTRYEKWLNDEQDVSMFLLSYMACFTGADGLDPIQVQASKLNGKGEVKKAMGLILEKHDLPIDDGVLEKLATLPLYRWSLEGYNDANSKLESCLAKIDEYESILSDDKKRKNVFRNEVKGLLKGKW